MHKRDVLEIAVKLMGLYSLLTFLGSIFSVVAVLLSTQLNSMRNKSLYVALLCGEAVLRLVFAAMLIRYGDRIAEMLAGSPTAARAPESTPLSAHARMSLWIRVLGLYFFLSVAPHVVWDIAEVVGAVQSPNWSTRTLAETLQLALSLLCIVRNESVAAFIEKHSKPV
jgi:hypothetical protein